MDRYYITGIQLGMLIALCKSNENREKEINDLFRAIEIQKINDLDGFKWVR